MTGETFLTAGGPPLLWNGQAVDRRSEQGLWTPESGSEVSLLVPSQHHIYYRIGFPGKLRSLGSTAAHFAWVARGAAVGAVARGRLWDLAGALACCRAAGVSFSYLSGAPLDMPSLLEGGWTPEPVVAAHPRDLERDRALCEAERVDILFFPAPGAVYAPDHSTTVEESSLSENLCGASRPGHFRGVTTIVAKLFNTVLPDVAVFGQKDGQQARVIERMTRDLNFPVRIVVAPTVREPDGLAMSSRNAGLSAEERIQALCLVRALRAAERLYGEGERSAVALRGAMQELIASYPLAQVVYIELVDNQTLEPCEQLAAPAMIALCVRLGATRLIDNTVLK